MNFLYRIFPEQASTVAGGYDALFYFLCALTFLVSLGIAIVIIYYAVRYRRKTKTPEPLRPVHLSQRDIHRMEYAWIGIPLVIFMGIFYWGAKLWASIKTPPDDAMQIYIVGKQWMWKSQHVSGRREINELHVPVGVPVKLTMTSEDVIHSFYIPAFRVKTDVLPGRYTELWFEATKTGEFHLFCAEYCGTKHSGMIGKIIVMEPKDFEVWLGGAGEGSLSEAGERMFTQLRCNTCHTGDSQARAPDLEGLYGSEVTLGSGDVVVADESYLRESILEPAKKVVAGYQPIMPPYAAQLSEEKVIQLIAYIKSLKGRGPPAPDAGASPSDAGTTDGGTQESADAGVPDGGTDAGTAPGP